MFLKLFFFIFMSSSAVFLIKLITIIFCVQNAYIFIFYFLYLIRLIFDFNIFFLKFYDVVSNLKKNKKNLLFIRKNLSLFGFVHWSLRNLWDTYRGYHLKQKQFLSLSIFRLNQTKTFFFLYYFILRKINF